MSGSNILSVAMFTLGLGLVVFAIRLFAHSMRGAFEENDQGMARGALPSPPCSRLPESPQEPEPKE